MKVANAEALTSIFGYWPSFHDAELVRLRLDRGSPDESGPSLEADIYVFEMTSEVSPAGFYVLRHHTLATLRFEDIHGLRIEGFKHQNALFGLTLDDIASRQMESVKWDVSFDSSEASVSLQCREIIVTAALPCSPQEPGLGMPRQSGPLR